MATTKLYYTKAKNLESLPVTAGNIIFVIDENMVCLDIAEQRFYYHGIKIFETDAERLEAPFVQDGFYLVAETNVLWRWRDGWIRLTSAEDNPIYYGNTEEDFPNEGEEEKLYFTDNGIYNWKTQLNKYNLIANANTWDGI